MTFAPNSIEFVLLAVLVTVVAFFGVRLLWRRSRGFIARFVSALAIQLLVLLTIGAYLNHLTDTATSWSSIAAVGTRLDVHTVAKNDLTALPFSPTTPNPGIPHADTNHWRVTEFERAMDVSDATESHVVTTTIPGVRTGYDLEAQIYLPGSYDTSATTDRRYPVIELFSGYPGTDRSWVSGLQLKQNLDSLISAGKMPAVIAIMPSQNPHPPRDAECVDAAPSAQAPSLSETYLVHDVPSYLAAHYRTGEGRLNWVVGGYSTGGYCAANLALRHPNRYSAVIALSGYFHALTDASTGPLFADEQQRRANSPQLTVQRPHLPIAFFLCAAADDLADAHASGRFREVLPANDPWIATTTATGGHTPPVWIAGSLAGFAWVASVLSNS